MAATIQSLVSETKRNRLSLIGPLTEDGVLRVWEKVAQFVEALMLQQKGVSIPGLGTFTFSKRRLDVGNNNKAIVIQRPVFVLSEKFIQTHSLQYLKQHTSGQVPLHVLNFTQLSNETGVSRELVEGGVREVLQALSRAVAARKNVEFDLKDIGRLTIHDGKAKMSFFREFILRLDGCCSDMEGVFRMSTAGSSICSIISNPQSPSRPSSTLSLPNIVQPQTDGDDMNLSLSCASEDASSTTPHSPHPSPSATDDNPSSGSYDSTRLSRQLEKESPRMSTISEEDEEEEDRVEEGEEGEEGGDVKEGDRVLWHEPGVCTVDGNGQLSPPVAATITTTSDPSDSASQRRLIPKPAVLLVGRGSVNTSTTTPPPPSTSKGRSSHQRGTGEGSHSRSNSSSSKSKHSSATSGSCSCSMHSSSVSRPSTCSHKSSAGQELCYLCHQRALSNVPIDMSKERAALEKWHSDTLQEYQRRSELLAMARDQAKKTKRRLINHDIATFNQSRAEVIKKQKATKSSVVDPSYVFCDRLLTPAPHHRQLRYCGDLDSQVEMKRVRFLREREEQERLGREEQERLAKDLAAYKELYRRMKAQAVEDYKAALNEQTRLKPIEASDTTTTDKDSQQQQQPVFGVHKVLNETCEKERAKVFFLDQLTMVEEKQRRAKEKALRALQEDANMLKITKEGLKADLRKERSRRVNARRAVEEEWLASMRDKQTRLLEDLQRAREQGIRLHQQCEKYQRCKQCQRKRENMGKSNILHETRYISGSRLMV